MWDLETIIRENNRVALEAMQTGERVSHAQAPHPAGWALSLLSDKLQCGPPLLTALIECFTESRVHDEFIHLIDWILTDSGPEIMAQPRNRRVYRFCTLFAEKYYPLPDWAYRMSMDDFARSMPVEILGLVYSTYHELGFRPGYLFLLSLVVYPFEGDDRDLEQEDEDPMYEGGARVPLMDVIQGIIGDLVTKIPADGWHPSDLHRMTDNTQYDGVGHFADWACAGTGCVVLDSSYEDTDYMEGYGEPSFQWTRHNVDILVKQWPRVKEYRAKIDRIVEWLERDPINNFTSLINFLDSCPKVTGKRKPIMYHDHMSIIPLQQNSEEERDYDEEITRLEVEAGV